jgi:hypothetical protein
MSQDRPRPIFEHGQRDRRSARTVTVRIIEQRVVTVLK